MFAWIGMPAQEPMQQVAQGPPPASAGQALELIETFKAVAGALHMDVWWLTLLTFSFVWGLRGVLRFVNVDLKAPPRLFGIFQLEEGWWPALRNWLFRGAAVCFASAVAALAQWIEPAALPEVSWIVLGPTYGLGAVLMYHVLDYVGVMAKLERRA